MTVNEKQQFIEELRGLQRIVINTCYGGFGLSDRAIEMYRQLSGNVDNDLYFSDINRDDPYLVQIVQKLGAAANNDYSNLKVVEVPAGVSWHISEYDGNEWVAEDHRTWS